MEGTMRRFICVIRERMDMVRKVVLAGISAGMMVCAPLLARAEITLTETAAGVSSFCEDGLYGLQDADGGRILEPKYDMIFPFYGGCAKVAEEDFYGLIDEQGDVILEAVYDDILPGCCMPADEMGESIGYNAFGYFAVEIDGKIGFVTEDGTVTCEIKYDEEDTEVNGASALLSDAEGNEAILSADGVLTPLEGYQYVSCLLYSSGALYKVQNEDGYYGVLDWHGGEVLPCEYERVSLSADGGYLQVRTDQMETLLFEVSYDLNEF